MNRRLALPFAAVLLVAMLVVPTLASAAKGGGKSNKPLVVCKRGCKFKTIQFAVDKVKKKNSTIYVLEGKYVEGVVIEGHGYDGLTIQGMKQKKDGKYKKAKPAKVILEGKNAKTPDGSTANNGIEGIDVNELTVKNLTARNYGANGFFVRDSNPSTTDPTIECNDYLFKNDVAEFNRSYGFYAFGCAGGRFTKSVGFGHGDSAFYVGATPPQTTPKTTRIDNVDAYLNVLGYSGTNSRYVTIEDSNWFNNGVGIVPNTLDSEPFEPTASGIIRNNDIYWNNFNYFLPNSPVKTVSDGLGTVEGIGTIQYPTGAGVVLLGADGWTVENNNIFGNFKWGAAVISDPFNEGDDATSKNNQFLNNVMGKGGTDVNAVDFFNQGSGAGNCFSGNVSSTFDPSGSATDAQLYPACPASGTNAGQTGDSLGDPSQFGELAAYVTTSPPENQECSWSKHPQSSYEGNEPVAITPGPTC